MKPCASLFPLAMWVLFPACTPAAEESAGDDDTGAGGAGESIQTEDQGDGSFLSVVDARDEAAFVYLDFEGKAEVAAEAGWDLGFQRFNVATHVEVAVLMGAAFDEVTAAPADGYVGDASDPETAMQETMPGFAFDLWYNYDPATHVLTARDDLVYVVRTPEGNYFKVQMLDYYDEAGSSGHVTLRWAPVAPPA